MKTTPVALLAIALAACSGKDAQTSTPATGAESIAQVQAAKALPPEIFTSTTAGFDLQLPGIWKGRYTASEHKDTTANARLAVEFKFVVDSGSKAPSQTLMKILIVPKASWEAASKRPGNAVGQKIAETAKDVYVLSLPASNPYPPGSRELPVFDNLLISIAQGGQQVHLTPR